MMILGFYEHTIESYDKFLNLLKISNLNNTICIFRPKKNYDYYLRNSNDLI